MIKIKATQQSNNINITEQAVHLFVDRSPKAITTTVTDVRGGIAFIVGNAEDVISTGWKGWFPAPYDFVLEELTLLADQSGSINVTIVTIPYANYLGDSTTGYTVIVNGATIAANVKNQLSYNASITEGDIIGVYVNSASSIELCTLGLKGHRTE